MYAACALAGLIFYGLAYMGCSCLYSFTYRSKLRGLFSLPEEPCNDCCIHCWCSYCAICQEYRELKNRGLDPSLGIYIINFKYSTIILYSTFFFLWICSSKAHQFDHFTSKTRQSRLWYTVILSLSLLISNNMI